jgi:hypothetical protein
VECGATTLYVHNIFPHPYTPISPTFHKIHHNNSSWIEKGAGLVLPSQKIYSKDIIQKIT